MRLFTFFFCRLLIALKGSGIFSVPFMECFFYSFAVLLFLIPMALDRM